MPIATSYLNSVCEEINCIEKSFVSRELDIFIKIVCQTHELDSLSFDNAVELFSFLLCLLILMKYE